MHALTEWRDFYVMIGTASGAMIGAAFIVATLTANLEKRALGLQRLHHADRPCIWVRCWWARRS